MTYPVGAVFDAILRMGPAMMSQLKLGLTVGLLPFNAMYFVGNFLSAFHMVYMKQGLLDTAGLFKHPKVTAAVMRRMFGEGRQRPGKSYFVAKDGRVFSADMLASAFEKGGLNQSMISSETITTLSDEIRKTHSGFIKRLFRLPFHWQDVLVDVATASDNAFRINVALQELDRGANMATATKAARDALFDYGKMTNFEQTWMKKMILFYSFQRRATDSFMDTLLRNPGRIFGTARVTENLHEYFLEGDPQIILPDWYKLRVPLFMTEAALNSRTQGTYTLAPPLPYADVVLLWGDVAGMVQDFALDLQAEGRFVGPDNDVDRWKTIATKLHPMAQGIFAMTYNKDAFYGRDLNGWNEVPPWFIEYDYLLFGGFYSDSILNVKPNMMDQDHEMRQAYRRSVEEGGTYFYAQNGRAWWMTRNLLHMIPGFGRNMDTMTSLDRANVGFMEGIVRLSRFKRDLASQGYEIPFWMEDKPNPIDVDRDIDPELMPPDVYERYVSRDTMGTRMGLESWQEMVQAAGLRQYLVPTEVAALDRFYKDQEFIIKDATKRLKAYATTVDPEEDSSQKIDGLIPFMEPDLTGDDSPLFDDDIETDYDKGDTGY